MQLPRKKQALGLDAGQTSVKALLLQRTGDRTEILSSEIFQMAKEGLLEEELYTENGIPKWLREHKLPQVNLTCAIPQEICTTQITDFPAPAKNDRLEQMVNYEIAQLAGLSDESFLSDYTQMSPVEGHENPTLIGICRQQIVQDSAERFTSCGITPYDFAMAGVAAAAAFLHCKKDAAQQTGLQVLLEIGADHTTAICLSGGSILSIGSLLFGANQFTTALARKFAMTEKDAEEFKRNWQPNWEEPDCPWQKPLAILLRELDAVLSHWRETENSPAKDQPIATLWLTGAGAYTKGLAENLSQKLQCPVKLFGPSVMQNGKMILAAPEYTVAYGLALQGLGASPIPLSIAPTNLRWRRKKLARFPYLVAAAVFFFFSLITTMVLSDLTITRRQEKLELELQKLERCSALVPELEQTREKIAYQQKLLLPIVELGSRGQNFLDAIREISNALTKDDWCIYLADEFSAQQETPKNEKNGREAKSAPRNIFEERNDESTTEVTHYQDIATMPLLSQMIVIGFTMISSNKRFEAILDLQNKLNACGLYQNVDWHVEQDGKDPVFLERWKAYLRQNANSFAGRYSDFTLALPLKQKNVILPPPVELKRKKKK